MYSPQLQLSLAWALVTICSPFLLWSLLKVLLITFDSRLRKVPGPWLSAFTYWPLKLAVLNGNRTVYIHALHEKYGPYVRISPTEIAIADIDAWRTIHRVGSDFCKNPKWYQGQSPLQTNDDNVGVFGLKDLKKARARRKLFQTVGTKKIVAEWEPEIVQLVDLTVSKIKRDLKEKQECDVMRWWTFMTNDVLASLAFGESFDTVKNEHKNQMIVDIESSMPLIGLRLEFRTLFDLFMSLPLSKTKEFNQLWYRFTEYGRRAVENTKRASKGLTKTLFSKMVLEDESQQLPDGLIEQEAANVIIAGTDTTAMTLTYLVYEVLVQDEIRRRLVEEIKAGPEHPNGEDLEKMQYLNNVIQETWRRHPAVPGSLPRVVPTGGVTFGHYFLPAGVIVSTQAWTFHQEPKVFEEPLRFDPDRWLNPTKAMKEHLMVFGGPARICVGQNIARLQLLHAVAKLFRECENVRLAPGTTAESMDMVDYFTIKPRAGVCMIVPA